MVIASLASSSLLLMKHYDLLVIWREVLSPAMHDTVEFPQKLNDAG